MREAGRGARRADRDGSRSRSRGGSAGRNLIRWGAAPGPGADSSRRAFARDDGTITPRARARPGRACARHGGHGRRRRHARGQQRGVLPRPARGGPLRPARHAARSRRSRRAGGLGTGRSRTCRRADPGGAGRRHVPAPSRPALPAPALAAGRASLPRPAGTRGACGCPGATRAAPGAAPRPGARRVRAAARRGRGLRRRGVILVGLYSRRGDAPPGGHPAGRSWSTATSS